MQSLDRKQGNLTQTKSVANRCQAKFLTSLKLTSLKISETDDQGSRLRQVCPVRVWVRKRKVIEVEEEAQYFTQIAISWVVLGSRVLPLRHHMKITNPSQLELNKSMKSASSCHGDDMPPNRLELAPFGG